jgi:transposase
MSRKTLQVLGYTPEQIKSLFKKDDRYSIGIRLYAVYQISSGKSSRAVQELYDTSFKQICNWVHRFEKEGIDGLRDRKKSGRKPRLDNQQLDEIKTVLQDNRPDEFGYNTSTWNGPLVIDYIKKKYGVEFKKANIYNILKVLGFTYQKGRAKYPEANEKQRNDFRTLVKKTSKRTT